MADLTANMEDGEERNLILYSTTAGERQRIWFITADGYCSGEIHNVFYINKRNNKVINSYLSGGFYGAGFYDGGTDSNEIPGGVKNTPEDSRGDIYGSDDGRAVNETEWDDFYESELFERYDVRETEPSHFELRDKDTGELIGLYGGAVNDDPARRFSLSDDEWLAGLDIIAL